MGVGEAACVPSLQVIAGNWVPQEYRSRFWGVLSACYSFGTLAALVSAPTLMERWGWPATFTTFGAVGVVLAVVWLLLADDTPDDAVVSDAAPAPETADTWALAEGATSQTGAFDGLRDVPWKQIATSPSVWALGAAHMASNFFNYFSASWLPTFFADEYGLDVRGASGASLAPFAAGALASPAAGLVADVLVDKGVGLSETRRLMQLVAALGPAACLVLLAEGHVDEATAQTLFVCALGSSSFLAAGYGVSTQDIARKYAPLIYGSTSAVAVLSGASAQVLTGAIIERNGGDFSPLFTLTAGVEVTGGLLYALWWRSDRVFD